MPVEETKELKKSKCGPLPWLPRRQMTRGEWYMSISCGLADLTLSEIRLAYEPLADKYPPVLGLEQAAEIAGLAPSTLQRLVSEGRYSKSVKRGKPLRFWRDKFVQEALK
jgi:hypothetical protein